LHPGMLHAVNTITACLAMLAIPIPLNNTAIKSQFFRHVSATLVQFY
jgi:hypothetical protein